MISRLAPTLLVCLILSSCDRTNRVSVDGVNETFCVPKIGYIAPSVWFVPEDASGAPQGFSFGGCHRLQSADRASCSLPDELISADVDSLSKRRNELWGELRNAAIFKAIAESTSMRFEVDPNSGYLVISNPTESNAWFAWKRATESQPLSANSLGDDDRLVVSCSEVEDYPRSAGLGRQGDYACERYVRGAQYALEYRFISKIRIPDERQLAELDRKLSDQVDRWRCPD